MKIRDIGYMFIIIVAISIEALSASIGQTGKTLYILSAITLSAGIVTAIIGIKSVISFSLGGPKIDSRIISHYKYYSIFSFIRLLLFTFMVLSIIASPGAVIYAYISGSNGNQASFIHTISACGASIILITALQFSRTLLMNPAAIAASYTYRVSRLYPYWRLLSPRRINTISYIAAISTVSILILGLIEAISQNTASEFLFYAGFIILYVSIALWLRKTEPAPKSPSTENPCNQPNIIMIGADTLRHDRINGNYPRNVAPNLTAFSRNNISFTNCYVPCARTAPSLISILTGYWPHRFGVRDNFVADEVTTLGIESFLSILKKHGYYTAGISDWCGADMKKFTFDFDQIDTPDDQWNIKLFLRQGPKDLRLFLTLFLRNNAGKYLLPEIFFLGGIPTTDQLGKDARLMISQLASCNRPFFLNIFFSTTHGPFGSEYPYYLKYCAPDYQGPSKFVMARLTDPWEIIRRQQEPREAFDLDQIIGLYDGCVSRFDDEFGKIIEHVTQCGILDNTIIAVYSDHGMEFFEHHTWGQGNSVISDISSRIPLILSAPGLPNDREITHPVRSIDIAPTLLDIIGIKSGPNMDGLSLLPCILDAKLDPCLEVFNETGIWLTDLPGTPPGHLRYPDLLELLTIRNISTGTISIKPEYEELVVRAKDRMIRLGKWKLVYQPLQNEYLLKLFDLNNDPSCLNNIANGNPEIVTDLWRRLKSVSRGIN
ncbi:MAG: sulfatase-like hydrolase/transferase [Gammaproteobacteria bacterium]|nr:sulfatase-like hydrolase/transferase [Gammaproteobacteria bacterium]